MNVCEPVNGKEAKIYIDETGRWAIKDVVTNKRIGSLYNEDLQSYKDQNADIRDILCSIARTLGYIVR